MSDRADRACRSQVDSHLIRSCQVLFYNAPSSWLWIIVSDYCPRGHIYICMPLVSSIPCTLLQIKVTCDRHFS